MVVDEASVIDRWRSVKPAAILVVQGDGATVRVAVPSKGQRWSRAYSVISKLPWSELRALNKSGEVLDVIVREPQGLEELPPAAATASAAGMLQLLSAYTVNLTRTLGEAMRTAREQAGAELGAILDAHRDLAREAFMARADAQQRQAEAEAEIARLKEQLAAATAGGADGGTAAFREGLLMKALGMGEVPGLQTDVSRVGSTTTSGRR